MKKGSIKGELKGTNNGVGKGGCGGKGVTNKGNKKKGNGRGFLKGQSHYEKGKEKKKGTRREF